MKLRLLTFLLICSVGITLAGNKPGRIKVEGNKFTNEQGETVVFRGLNASDPDKLLQDGHWNEAYFE